MNAHYVGSQPSGGGRFVVQRTVLLLAAACLGSLTFTPRAWAIDVYLQRTLQREILDAEGDFDGAVAFGDLDGDGDLDLAFAIQTEDTVGDDMSVFKIRWRRNEASGSWVEVPEGSTITYEGLPTPLPNPAGDFTGNDEMSDLVIGDVDGDGDNDILACTLVDGIFWFENQDQTAEAGSGNGSSWSSAIRIYEGRSAYCFPNVREISLCDVDDDGDQDIVAAISESGGTDQQHGANQGSKVSVLCSDGADSPAFSEKIVAIDPELKFIYSVCVARLVGSDDGLELVVATLGNDDVRWYVNQGGSNGTLAFSAGYRVTDALTDPYDVHAGDFDGDGDQDIVTASKTSTAGAQVVWYENVGTSDGTNFQTATVIDDSRSLSDNTPLYVQAVDFDADGDVDVLVSFSDLDLVVYYENLGDGSAWTAHDNSIEQPGDGPELFRAEVVRKAGPDDAYVDLVVGAAGADKVTFYDNVTYNEGPSLVSIEVVSDREIFATFSKQMNSSDITDAANYTISGAGMGSLNPHPDHVALDSGNTYSLTWDTGSLTVGQQVTVTVDSDVREHDGDAIQAPIHEPKSQSATVGDTASPTVTVDTLVTNDTTPTVTGTVADNVAIASVQATVNGNTYTATLDGSLWSADVVDVLPQGTYDVQAAATDTAANTGTDSTTGELTVDTTPPGIAIDEPSAAITASGPVTYAVTYTQAASITLAEDDVIVNATDGAVAGSVTVSGTGASSRTVTLDAITGNGTLAITIAGGTAADMAGNLAPAVGPSTAFTVDNTAMSIGISAPSVTVTRTGSVTYTVEYGNVAAVTLTVSDVTLNLTGTATGTPSVTDRKSEGTITKTVAISNTSGDGTIGIAIAAGTATDSLGNLAPAAGPSATFEVDNTPPTVAMTSVTPNTTNVSPIPVTVTLSEEVTGFDAADINTTATVDDFAGNGAVYSFHLVPAGEGQVSVNIPAGVAQDEAGNGNAAAATFTRTYDITPPTVTITAPSVSSTDTGPVEFTVVFGEAAVVALATDNVTLNATGTAAGTVSVSGTGATLRTVTISEITGNGSLAISIDAGTAQDEAGNLAPAAGPSPTFAVVNDVLDVWMTSTAPDPTRDSPIPVSVIFSQSVTGFTASDVVVTNASIANFTGSGADYGFDLVPLDGGIVTADIPAGVAQNTPGDPNVAAQQFHRIYAPPITYYVDITNNTGTEDGSSDYPFNTIAEAVDASSEERGDVIAVSPGVYEEQIALKSALTLSARSGAFVTRITGAGKQDSAALTLADGTVVRGFGIDVPGGAAVSVPSQVSAEVTNCVLHSSVTGVYVGDGGSVAFVNNTVYGNDYGLFGEAGAVFDILKNTIFAGNGTAIASDVSAIAEGGYNDYFDNVRDFDGPDGFESDISVDPEFLQAAEFDFRLSAGSLCRDAGDPASEYNDLDGSRNDIGAEGGPYGVQYVEDSDEDGLPDGWEMTHFGDIHLYDGQDDPDEDGLTNEEEHAGNTDPMESDTDQDGISDGGEVDTYGTDPNNPDSDGDGLTDGDEVTSENTDPNDADSDDDGFSDGEEVDAGTDPNDEDDFPSASTPVLSVSPGDSEVAASSGAAMFTVSNNGTGAMPWTASVTQGDFWLVITSGDTGTDSGAIEVTYSANETADERIGRIQVDAPDAPNSPVVVTLRQLAEVVEPPVLWVSPDHRDVASPGGTASFAVGNDGGGTLTWTASVTEGASWLSITSGDSGLDAGIIEVSCAENTQEEARTGTIRVEAAGATGSPADVTVTQAGLCAAPAVPANVQATDGTLADRVRVTWEAASAATSYQVYRSESDNSGAAELLGTATDAQYDDTTAELPAETPGPGCFGTAEPTYYYYYYWVQAVNDCGESALSVSDQGYVGQSGAEGKVFERALPSTWLGERVREAQVDSALSVRLCSVEAIDPSSVWGVVTGAGFESESVEWLQVADSDGWVTYRPERQWAFNEKIVMTAGGATVSGVPVGPETYAFEVESQEQCVARMNKVMGSIVQPASIAPDTGGQDLSAESDAAITVNVAGGGSVPAFPLPGAVGSVYVVGPDEPYATPQRVWLPVPANWDASELAIYYYHAGGADSGWYAPEDVEGWLAQEDYLMLESEGVMYLGVLVRHAGVVQLGTGEAGSPAASLGGALPGALDARDVAGDLLVVVSLALLLFVCPRPVHQRRRTT